MNWLCFDTSSASGSISLVQDSKIRHISYFDIQTTHSETLLPFVETGMQSSKMQISEIDAVLVTIGPGSFTGLRIGLATAKGICMAREIPLLPFCSLQLLASNCYSSSLPILAIQDAKMNEVYAALYDSHLQELMAPVTISPLELSKLIQQPVLAVGSGYAKYGELLIANGMQIQPALPHQHLPLASGLLSLQQLFPQSLVYDFEAIAELEPAYLRRSQAEMVREHRLREKQ